MSTENDTISDIRKALQEIHKRVNSLDEECGVDPIEIRDIARAALALLSNPVKNDNSDDAIITPVNNVACRNALADVLAAMRNFARVGRGHDGTCSDLIESYADRIDAAAKRERAELEANALAVGGVVEAARNKPSGNAAAMREALEAVKKSIDGIGASSLDCDPVILMASLTQVCARLSARIDAALAKPPRNCDVGTAQEQTDRYETFCASVHPSCVACKADEQYTKCEFVWGQMPYEKGGAK